MEESISGMQLRVGGMVQGVGFRPYVYALAQELGLNGYVQNDGAGVCIAIEGGSDVVGMFLERLPRSLPPLARIDSCETTPCEAVGYDDFRIVATDRTRSKHAVISPDMAVCEHCLAEMRDPADRRYGYWLINCTDCGPRYSIIETVPYDRPNTSMRRFEMCTDCRTEYENPLDRRYHAQPISCPCCGPKTYYRENGTECEGEQALMFAAEALKSGKIVAVKGLGGFHLMCDATHEATVRLLRERKRRPAKPFAVMFPSAEAIREAAVVTDAEALWIDSRERPVVLVRSKPHAIAPSVAPTIDRLGVFLPYTPLHYRLFESIDIPLVATSANLSDEPIVRTDDELALRLSGVADAVLTHERDIVNACDDSVMHVVGNQRLMLRLARGFAPYTITLPFRIDRRILAVGANQKNTIALAFGNQIVMAPHIGDLGSLEAFEYFERTLETFRGFYDFEPDVIVCDKHPGYETTRWAYRQKMNNEHLEIIEVQHHYAHILAALAEYHIEERVLGFACDGTGYGDDGTIWGGEVLMADRSSYERLFSLRPFSLPGGEKAVREPRRSALGLLFEYYTLDAVIAMECPTVRAFHADEIRGLHAAWKRGVNTPRTSSAGRLFDAVASLAGVCQQCSYEGESGLLLETVVEDTDVAPYAFTIEDGSIDSEAMIREIIEGTDTPSRIASRFLVTLVEIMVGIARRHACPVVLTGGVFQNRTLLERVMQRFREEDVGFYLPSAFPVNDGCIALGQIWYAAHRYHPET